MSRFVEDYNEDLHRLPSWIGYLFGQAGASDVLLDEVQEELDPVSGEETETNKDINLNYAQSPQSNNPARDRSDSARYKRHV